ncbi:MAG: hypothetical protein WCO06_05365 [Candidatus Roizmanbacteria bacterium]
MPHTNHPLSQSERLEYIKKRLNDSQLNPIEIYTLMDQLSYHSSIHASTHFPAFGSVHTGFSIEELHLLTLALVSNHTKLDLSGFVSDKQSTGGALGSRTSLIVTAIIVASGFMMPKIASRANRTPAGTVDVMEVFTHINLIHSQVLKTLERARGCIVSDQELWNFNHDHFIRFDEPVSFSSFDKIIISLFAKKLLTSVNHLVIDIPVGKNMLIKKFSDGETIAHTCIMLGKRFGITVSADIHEIYEPIGSGVGVMIEAKDTLEILENNPHRPKKLEDKSIRLAGKLLDICYKDQKSHLNGKEVAKEILFSGKALTSFKNIIEAQGGNPDISSQQLSRPIHTFELKSKKSGTIYEIDMRNMNTIAKILGAPQDKQAGIHIIKHKKDIISNNEVLAEIYANDIYHFDEAVESLENLPIYTIEN